MPVVPPLLSPDERHARTTIDRAEARRDKDILPEPEFVSMLAHELRNPLQSMAMANQLLASAAETHVTVAHAHGVLDRQIKHMSRLLDDLLDASRAASGKIVLQLGPVCLRDVIHAAIESSHAGVLQRRQTLTVNVHDDGIAVSGDLVRLAQAFANLLTNASQFSDNGGNISIDAVCRTTMAEITISDQGVGIAPELQPYIFDLFTQGHRTLDRAPGGLGIGLSLVRTIVRMHGGEVTVFSAGAGAGSRFSVRLPLVPTVPPPALPQAPRGTAACNILVIEDNVDANEIMAMLLEINGHRVTSSFDGLEGLRLALAGNFDVVLCDLGLPGLTGLEVVAGIKASSCGGKPLVIATTGYSDGAQRDLARAAGFDQYLVKPLNMPALLQAIADRDERRLPAIG